MKSSEVTDALTVDAIRDTIRLSRENHERMVRARAERMRRFYEAVPEELHQDPLFLMIATLVYEGITIHPRQRDEYARRLDALIAGAERDGGD